MRKKIAVFICAISFSNQRRILEGILSEAKEKDFDVFVFTCHVNHSASHMKIKGAFSVMLLPDFSEFDGAIVMKSSIRDSEISDALIEKIRKSKIPAVSIEEDNNDMHCVSISNYDAQMQIMEHFIVEHNCKRICYVTGLLSNKEGQERFLAYKDAMAAHHLIYGEEDIYYGNYISNCGKDAVHQFLKGTQKIDAIICANDGMAIGVISELHEMGYKIPEDVLVAGFDNDTFSRFSIPMLTTIDQNQEEIGKNAVCLLLEPHNKNFSKKCVQPHLIIGESCGCKKQFSFPVNELRQSYGREIGSISQAVDSMKNMSIELAGLESMDMLYERLKKYILASDMEAFYLCLEDECNNLSIPLAYDNKSFQEIGPYRKGAVLPDYLRDTSEPSFYIATSLFYSDVNFGYIIQRGSHFALESDLAYSWIVNVAIAIENIRKIGLMKDMLNQLNTMWMYDTLTNLYNRGGFYHIALPLLEQLQKDNQKCYLIFFDLDGLKAINDGQGHEMGDKYICCMADVIRQAIGDFRERQSVAMRYGGDEFVVFGACKDTSTPEELIQQLNRIIDNLNQNNTKFNLSCSMGVSVHDANTIADLNGIVEEADKRMYEQKKAKKAWKK